MRWLLLLSCCVLLSTGSARPAGPAPPLGDRCQTLLVAVPGSGEYRLDHGLLVAGSESVEVDGLPLPDSEYRVDYRRGLVWFRRPLPAWSAVRVGYRCIRFSGAGGTRRLMAAAAPLPGESVLPPAELRDAGPGTAPDGDLDVGGSKSVGFAVGGTEGTGINQATRLNVTGSIGGVGVAAELSDQSSPIPAEGTTRDIEELDRIVIELAGSGWRGGFGDVDLDVPMRGFGDVRRRALGALVALDRGPGRLRAGYARPRGQFARVLLSGIEGIQGPYVLAVDGRSAQVVPGSEEVYLDGRRLTRGWDSDYTIDYATGELLLTNRHPVTDLTRIEASFQYVTEEYERDDAIGTAEATTGPWQLGLGLLREGDDRDRRLAGELTVEEVDYLAGIGADTSRAWFEGGRYVGAGEGDYVVEGGHYRYAGRDSGDYEVAFTLVGDSLGDYVYDDTLAGHRYIGPGAGDYVARAKVVLPERREFVHAHGEYRRGFAALRAAGAFSRRQRNLFAPGGAPVQDGAADLGAEWGDDRNGASYRGRLRGADFEFPGTDSAVDFSRRWGGIEPEGYRHTSELVLRGSPFDRCRLTGEAGVLNEPDGTARSRWRAAAEAAFISLDAARAGDEARVAAAAAPTLGWLSPRVGWSDEVRAGRGTRSVSTAVGVRPGPGTDCTAGYACDWVRAFDSLAGANAPVEDGDRVWLDVRWQRPDFLQLEGLGACQRRRISDPAAPDWTHWTATGRAALTLVPGAALRGDFSQSYRLVQLNDEVFRYVGPGNGEYSRDTLSGRYYYDEDGEYERVVVAKGVFTPAREQSLVLSGELASWRPLALTGAASATGTSSDSSALQRLVQYDGRAALRALEPAVTAYVGLSGSHSQDRTLYVTGRASRSLRRYAELASTRNPAADLRLSGELLSQHRENAAGELEYRESGWSVSFEPVLRAVLDLEFKLGIGSKTIAAPAGYAELGEFRLTTRELSVARSATLVRRLQVRVEGGFTQRAAGVEYLPYEVALTQPLGLTPAASAALTYAISEVVTASADYRFSDRPDRPSEHRLAGEVRAYF